MHEEAGATVTTRNGDCRVAKLLRKQINNLAGIKTQRQIADETGYRRPNVISMLKSGQLRVPLEKVPSFAKALNLDPAFLFRLMLEEYWPDRLDAVTAVFGTVLTANEAQILARLRELTNDSHPGLTQALDEALVAAL